MVAPASPKPAIMRAQLVGSGVGLARKFRSSGRKSLTRWLELMSLNRGQML